MSLARYLRHLSTGRQRVRRIFNRKAVRNISDAISASEKRHRGQLRFVAEASLPAAWVLRKRSARDRAIDLFSSLRVWDTEENSGVLLYLLVAERRIEIVADRGIHLRAQEDAWREICGLMENLFRQGSFEEGVLLGIDRITQLLEQHFPATGGSHGNELPDWPVLL